MKKIKFRLAAYTDAAGKRNDVPPLYGNEDNFYVDADLSEEPQGEFSSDEEKALSDYGSLLVIADGMGGMNAGEVASEIAVRTVKECFAHKNLTDRIVADAESRERYMEHVVEEADAAIKARSQENKECEGMGSTIIMVWICDGVASVTWCGDSRAYLFREPKGIAQISKDHSYVQSLVDDGKITEEEAFDHPYGNIITRSLGDPEKKAKADSVTVPLYKGDIILVCSDGLSGVLRDRPLSDGTPAANLEEIIRSNRSSMQSCREALFSAAEEADWYDNVTAILYEITDGAAAPEPECDKAGTEPAVSKSFINIRINKKRLLYWIIALIAVEAVVCGGFFGIKFLKETDQPAPAEEQLQQPVPENPGTQVPAPGESQDEPSASASVDVSAPLTDEETAGNSLTPAADSINSLPPVTDSINSLTPAADSINGLTPAPEPQRQ